MKIAAVLLLAVLFFDVSAYSQTKKKTDAESAELLGSVHKIHLTRKLIMSLDGEKEFGDGWLPGLIVFNRDGHRELLEARSDQGECEYKIVSRFNSSGQKIEEIETKANGQRNWRRTFAYDKAGNQIESNGYYGRDDVSNDNIRQIFDEKGFGHD